MVMKANFKAIEYKSLKPQTPERLDEHLEYLNSYKMSVVELRKTNHEGYPGFVAIDILGEPLKWANEEFVDREWYLWFESVFLVPEDMASLIMLKWS
jgi:hypothetical protein